MHHPHMSFARRQLPAAIAAILGLAGTASIHAQETDVKLKEMTVSAGADKPVQQRTELGKLTEYTPISGAVVSQEELEHLQLGNNLLELGKRVPGISMIRNMRIPDGGKLYTENRIDGMRATATSTSVLDEIDPADIERLEIITGPASTLYGSGAFGGTISVFTKQPPREFQANLSQEIGSWDFQRTKGYLGGSFADGRVGFIVTGSTMNNDGWRKNTAPTNNDPAAEKKEGGTVRALIRPTDSTKLTLGYSKTDYNYRWAGPIPMNATEAAKLRNQSPNGTNLRTVYYDNDWQQTVPGTYGQYIDDYTTGSFRLQQIVGNRGELTIAHTRIDNNSTNNGNGGSGGANGVICDNVTVICNTVNVGTAVTNLIRQTDAVTNTTLAMYRQEFDWAKTTVYAGTEVIDIATDSTTWNNANTALQGQSGLWNKGTLSRAGSLSKQKETTPFVHVEVSPLDKLRLHLGQRFARVDYNVDDRKAPNKDVMATVKGDVLRSGLSYELGRDNLVWASRSETFNPQAATSFIDSANKGTARNVIGAVLKPERGLTHELGFRGLLAGPALRYDLTFYHGNNRNYIAQRDCTAAEQATLNLGSACRVNENVGSLVAKGLEAMLNWAATPWLDLGMTYTNQRVYYGEYRNAAVDYTGKTYQATPRHKLNLRVGVKPAPNWLVELEGDHISDYFVDITNNNGSYQRPDLFSLRASYRQKDWSFWLHAINLTNQKYATRVQYSTIGGVNNVLSSQAGQGNAGTYTPLTLRAGVSYQF